MCDMCHAGECLQLSCWVKKGEMECETWQFETIYASCNLFNISWHRIHTRARKLCIQHCYLQPDMHTWVQIYFQDGQPNGRFVKLFQWCKTCLIWPNICFFFAVWWKGSVSGIWWDERDFAFRRRYNTLSNVLSNLWGSLLDLQYKLLKLQMSKQTKQTIKWLCLVSFGHSVGIEYKELNFRTFRTTPN
jgi:hypothetical protein